MLLAASTPARSVSHIETVANPDQAFLEGWSNRRAPKDFICFNTPGYLGQSLRITQKWLVTFSRLRKWLFLLVDLCDLSGNHRSLKLLFISEVLC